MLTYTLDLIGVAVFAISGALAAGRKSLDLIGVGVIAAVTAIGGGTIRDLLLDRHPIFWIADANYLYAIAAGTCLTLIYVRYRRPPHLALLVADGLGLALFTIIGARIAESTGASPAIAVLMGMVTGVFGGVVRDVLCVQIPLILRSGHLYASAALLGGILYITARRLGLDEEAAALAGMAAVAALRFASILLELRVPTFTVRDDEPPQAR